MGAALYALVHLVTYGTWRTLANKERKSRPDGKNIPYYATGGIGNAVGFTLVAISVGMAHPIPSLTEIVVAVGAGLVVGIALHIVWKQDAMKRTVSLYLPSGKATPAGRVHLFYVVLVTSLSVLLYFSWNMFTTLEVTLSLSGLFLYTVAVVIDRWRGII